MNESYICVIGASIIDLTGFSKDQLIGKDYNLGKIKISMGGVARNIAENLSRLNLKVKLISTIGDDHFGMSMIEHGKKAGIDFTHSLIVENKATALNIAIIGPDKSLAVGFTDLTIMDELSVEFIKTKKDVIKNASIVILETNVRESVLQQIIKDNPQQKFVLDTAAGPTAKRAKNLLSHLFILKTNEIEAGILFKDNMMNKKIFTKEPQKHLFITEGEKGVQYFSKELQQKYLPKTVKAVNTNGAGDAFLSGVIYGYIKKAKADQWVKMGFTLAENTILQEETVSQNIDARLFEHFFE
ncbi:MAG: PfkB family carbohydrate kinase [Bacteroidota bacterium]